MPTVRITGLDLDFQVFSGAAYARLSDVPPGTIAPAAWTTPASGGSRVDFEDDQWEDIILLGRTGRSNPGKWKASALNSVRALWFRTSVSITQPEIAVLGTRIGDQDNQYRLYMDYGESIPESPRFTTSGAFHTQYGSPSGRTIDRSWTLVLTDETTAQGATGPIAVTAAKKTSSRRRRRMPITDIRKDSRFIDLGDSAMPLASTVENATSRVTTTRTDGIVYEPVGEVILAETGKTIGVGKKYSAGVHITGPEQEDDARTLYVLQGEMNSNVAVEVGISVANASPSAAAAGDATTRYTSICASPGGNLMIDETIAVAPFTGTEANRAMTVSVSAVNNGTTSATAWIKGTLSVQRLVAAPPPIIDRRIG